MNSPISETQDFPDTERKSSLFFDVLLTIFLKGSMWVACKAIWLSVHCSKSQESPHRYIMSATSPPWQPVLLQVGLHFVWLSSRTRNCALADCELPSCTERRLVSFYCWNIALQPIFVCEIHKVDGCYLSSLDNFLFCHNHYHVLLAFFGLVTPPTLITDDEPIVFCKISTPTTNKVLVGLNFPGFLFELSLHWHIRFNGRWPARSRLVRIARLPVLPSPTSITHRSDNSIKMNIICFKAIEVDENRSGTWNIDFDDFSFWKPACTKNVSQWSYLTFWRLSSVSVDPWYQMSNTRNSIES